MMERIAMPITITSQKKSPESPTAASSVPPRRPTTAWSTYHMHSSAT